MIHDKRFDYSPETGTLKIDKRVCKNDLELKNLFETLEKVSWEIGSKKSLWYFELNFYDHIFSKFRHLFDEDDKKYIDVILLTPNWIPLLVWQLVPPAKVSCKDSMLKILYENCLLDETFKFVLLKNSQLLGVVFSHEISAYTLSNQISDSESSHIVFKYAPPL